MLDEEDGVCECGELRSMTVPADKEARLTAEYIASCYHVDKVYAGDLERDYAFDYS